MKERTTQDEREMSARQKVIWSPLPRSLEMLQHASGASARPFAVSVCVLVHECVSLLLAGVCALAMRWRVLQLPSQMCLDKKSRVQWGRRGRAVPIGVCARWPVGRKGKNAYSLRVAHGL